MAQIHPFTNPFFKSASFESSHNKDEGFSPYANLFNFSAKNNPWAFPMNMSQNWVEYQQKYWQEYMEFFTWQQQTLHQNLVDSAQVAMHCMQLSSNPSHLVRYIRRNWQKPYMTLGAQSLHATKLMTKIMTNNMCAWQNAFNKH